MFVTRNCHCFRQPHQAQLLSGPVTVLPAEFYHRCVLFTGDNININRTLTNGRGDQKRHVHPYYNDYHSHKHPTTTPANRSHYFSAATSLDEFDTAPSVAKS